MRTPNQFLRALPAKQLALIRPNLRPLTLHADFPVVSMGRPVTRIIFVENGLVSWVRPTDDGEDPVILLDPGTFIGGQSLFRPNEQLYHKVIPVVDASGWQIARKDFAAAMAADPLLMRHVQAWVEYIEHTTEAVLTCRAAHDIRQRFCGKLLLIRDALGSDRIPLTKAHLGRLMAAEGSYVSKYANRLEAEDIIRIRRHWHIDIKNVDALHERACSCFSEVAAMREAVLTVAH